MLISAHCQKDFYNWIVFTGNSNISTLCPIANKKPPSDDLTEFRENYILNSIWNWGWINLFPGSMLLLRKTRKRLSKRMYNISCLWWFFGEISLFCMRCRSMFIIGIELWFIMKCFISRSFRADLGDNQKNISIDHDRLPDSIISYLKAYNLIGEFAPHLRYFCLLHWVTQVCKKMHFSVRLLSQFDGFKRLLNIFRQFMNTIMVG